jgi:hypothetical protein
MTKVKTADCELCPADPAPADHFILGTPWGDRHACSQCFEEFSSFSFDQDSAYASEAEPGDHARGNDRR